MLIEFQYSEGSHGSCRYRAEINQNSLAELQRDPKGWFEVERLERWDPREGECFVSEPDTGERLGPTRMRCDRVLSLSEVGPASVTCNPRRAVSYTPSLRGRIETFFGQRIDGAVVIKETFGLSHLVNYDLAINELIESHAESHDCFGFANEVTGDCEQVLRSTLSERGPDFHIRVQTVKRIECPVGPDQRRLTVVEGVYLIRSNFGAIALAISQESMNLEREAFLEVLALEQDVAVRALEELRSIRQRINVFRGQVITLRSDGSYRERASVDFVKLDFPASADLVLPEGRLERIEKQAISPIVHRSKLISAGFSTRRGLLMHGPPGTGKTLTVRYLLGKLKDHTRILLAGKALGQLAQAYDLARTLKPSVVVLEDVDLIAQHREQNMHGETLHDLLDALDGLERHGDITTIITSNRPEALEKALSERPGRIDQAIEIPLPGPRERERLMQRFARDMQMDANLSAYVVRTEGASGAFLEELLRRALVNSCDDGTEAVTDEHLDLALGELLESSDQMTRGIVGFRRDDDIAPSH